MRQKSFLDRVLKFMGIEEQAAAAEDAAAPAYEPEPRLAGEPRRKPRSPLGSIGPARDERIRVAVIEPQTFDDVQSIADHLKAQEPVVLSLDHLDKETARRIMDFLSGTMYALDGHIQRLNDQILLLAPGNVEIDGRMQLTREDGEPFE